MNFYRVSGSCKLKTRAWRNNFSVIVGAGDAMGAMLKVLNAFDEGLLVREPNVYSIVHIGHGIEEMVRQLGV